MPLAEARRGVTLVTQHLRQGEAPFLDQTRTTDSGEHAASPDSKRHLPGKQTIACRCTNRRRAVGISKKNPFSSELVQVGSRDLRFRVVAGYISIAQIVGKNNHNIGFPAGYLFADAKSCHCTYGNAKAQCPKKFTAIK